jgi:hypothetical protein
MQEPSPRPDPASKDGTVSRESLATLYSATTDVAHAFYEWRHRVISLYLLAAGGIFVFAGWLHDKEGLRGFIWLPFVLGSALSCILALMDRVNSGVIAQCYKVAADLETELHPDSGGVFAALSRSIESRPTYSRILRIVYWGSAIVFALTAMVLALRPIG